MRRAGPAITGLIGLLVVFAFPAAAHAAPQVKPWLPTGMDSVNVWAALARSGFRTNTGDSVGGSNIDAYVRVGKIGRLLLGQLGRDNFAQAKAVEPVIDSLGLDVEVAVDPTFPYFAILMVRNPFRFSANAMGFLFWFVHRDLHYEGVKFETGRNVVMRVWRARYVDEPFSWGVLEDTRNASLPLEFTLLRMASTGLYWNAKQYHGAGPDLGGRGDATFADLNNDGIPEIVSWTRAPVDSSYLSCEDCPKVLVERTWAERQEGFEMVDSRIFPSAYANFVALTRYLREGNRGAASRLMANPQMVTRALADGWGSPESAGPWRVINVEPDETWPHWMVVRHGRGAAAKSWAVHFTQLEGRWIVRDWIEERVAKPGVRAR